MFFHKGADLPDSYESIISSVDNNVSFGSELWYQLKNGWYFILGLAMGAAVFAQIIGWFCDRDRHAKAIAILPFIVALSVLIYLTPGCWALWIIGALGIWIMAFAGAMMPFQELCANVLDNI